MKQCLKMIASFLLITTLVASVCAGAISGSIKSAKADTPGSYSDLYVSTLASYIQSTGAFTTQELASFWDYVGPKIADNPSNTNYCFNVIWDRNTGCVCCCLYETWNGTFLTTVYSSGTVFLNRTPSNNGNMIRRAGLVYNPNLNGNEYHFIAQGINGASSYFTASGANQFSGETSYYACFPNPYDIAISGRQVFCSKAVGGTSTCPQNLFPGDPPPQYEPFNLIKFTLGSRTFLTVDKQWLLVSDIYAEHLYWRIYNLSGDLIEITFHDLTEFPEGSTYIDQQFIYLNQDDHYVYAYEITDLDWAVIESSDMFDILPSHIDVDVYAVCENVPFNIQEDAPAPDPFSSAWEQFNIYVNQYNTNHVIPEQLSDYIFGTNGSKLFPVSVQFPGKMWYDGYDVNTADLSVHTFSWGNTSMDELAINFDLMDTVILGAGGPGYGLRYFYSDTLDPMYNFIDAFQFTNILESADVVIIVPEDYHLLNEFYSATGAPVAYTGAAGEGISFTTDPLLTNVFTGFAILTERCFQKQMLWNFNDGIDTFYQLQVDYIDSEDNWKDSFLLWTASLFDQWNSLDGHLNSIDNLLASWKLEEWFNDIKVLLQQLVDDEDPDNLQPWYLSLWNFVILFKPTNSDFAVGIDEISDTFDNLPLLPDPSPVPTIPLIGGGS